MAATGHAKWTGDLDSGSGTLDSGTGAVQGEYSAASRFADGEGTNPEELIATAHAACFSMALSLVLGGAGHVPATPRPPWAAARSRWRWRACPR